ncbi:DUF1735 domain-containing protein [Segetibacter sp. 3557_3]|uniref:DUF5627 domain-containing protein n=1 Tax=Segetibacter sp. 3557_3 TaxID=2547429 RepID=UPI0010584ECD|nr:DUF5627 domain-containing protein [Segetibacter sp. 3557_3]TDH23466.1 DUF1735 domain-containing protein [Segetibacter sp. 3557_3]
MKRLFLISSLFLLVLTACNKDWEFPDYKFSTVYFPYQSPVRTLVLGEDIFDNTLDNQRKFSVMATMGGVYENKKDVTLDVLVENTLTQRLKFNTATGDDVVALPANYYTLPQDMKIRIPAGKVMGGMEVQLTDAFFADPRSIKNTFVLPLKIVSVTNADSILKGTSSKTTPDPRQAGDWGVAPKDYVLYAVKYINPFHGAYLRRGIDEVKGNNGNTALDTTVVYRNAFVEQDEVVSLFTRSLTQDSISLNAKNKGNINAPFRLVLTFDNAGKCTVSAVPSATYTVSGSGQFVKKGDMWGNEKRDVLHLKYQVNFGTTTHNLTDTLVMRDRAVKFETFSMVVN